MNQLDLNVTNTDGSSLSFKEKLKTTLLVNIGQNRWGCLCKQNSQLLFEFSSVHLNTFDKFDAYISFV